MGYFWYTWGMERVYNNTLINISLAVLVLQLSTQAVCHADAKIFNPAKPRLQRLQYNNPGLFVDLSAGLWAWPIPMDYDGDGDLDLVVSCPDVPYNGTYLFENPGGNTKFPVFKPARRIGRGTFNIMPSFVGGKTRILMPGLEVEEFTKSGLKKTVELPVPKNVHGGKIRANQWRYADYDGDGQLDLIVGVGDWKQYGWDNAFDDNGRWTRGPLHGYVYLLRNRGTTGRPDYEKPAKIDAAGRPVDVYGMPSPNLADFDGDGDLDLICGEFVDRLKYFQNIGTRTEPKYATGIFLKNNGEDLRMDLCMIVPVAIDWDRDGDVDLVVGQEDGRVALVENTGKTLDGTPVFLPPRFFCQEAGSVKFGALATPCGVDFDGDGDDDLVCGNSAGYIGLIENLGNTTGNAIDSDDANNEKMPRFAAPKYLTVDGQPIRVMAGHNGSIQGPCETKWGYTTLTAADWDADGLTDLVVNSIWGKVVWYRNIGTLRLPKLAAARTVEVHWPNKPPKPAWFWWNPKDRELATQWRTTPFAMDYNRDGLCDLVMLDHEGFLCLFPRIKRDGKLVLLPPQRIFMSENGRPFQLSGGHAGASGRRKFCLVDWDRDGRLDLLVNGRNIDFLRNIKQPGEPDTFHNSEAVDSLRLAGHSTSPTAVDWDKDGVDDLVVGGEDGHFYYLKNPNATKRNKAITENGKSCEGK